MLSLTLLVVLIIKGVHHIFASYCGEDAIPFSLQVLQSGQPVLGCARPSCFGWGKKRDKGARFYRINKKNDGFIRYGDLNRYDKIKFVAQKSQIAVCEQNYGSSSCDENTQWVGGLSPSSNITRKLLRLKCCAFDDLKNSWDRGIADVSLGQIVVGGEVMQDERQYAFDYIANVRRYFKTNGSVAYSVTVRRFWCLPYPKSNLHVDENALPYIMDRIEANPELNINKAANLRRPPQQVFDEISNSFTNHEASQKSFPGTSRVSMLSDPSLSAKDSITSIGSLSSANEQHHSMVPFNTNHHHHLYVNASAGQQPLQFNSLGHQKTFQQQPEEGQIFPQQPQQGSYLIKSQESQQQQMQSLLPNQQSATQQSSKFPVFPSFDQNAFSLS